MTLSDIRKQYGSFRSACQWYGTELRMSKNATAQEFGIPIASFYRLLTRFDCHGYFLPIQKQRGQSRGKGSQKPGSGNREAVRLSRRKPIEYRGVTYYPGEVMHHYLFQKGAAK